MLLRADLIVPAPSAISIFAELTLVGLQADFDVYMPTVLLDQF
jgi:hypothetical protein